MAMDETEYRDDMDRWRNSTAAMVSVMKNEMDHIRDDCSRGYARCEQRIDGLTARVNDGLSTRLSHVENEMLRLDSKYARYELLLEQVTQRLDRQDEVTHTNRAWMRNVAATLLCALILGFVGQYLTGNTKVATVQQEIQQLTQQIRELKPRSPWPP